MSTRLRIGIIGAGYIGNVHASVLRNHDRVQIASVYDIAKDQALSIARPYGADVAESPEELIDSVDVVYVTTPNTRHTGPAIAALQAGKHVFCEKPMATTAEDAAALLEAASQSSTVFQVGHNRRFAPVYQRLKQLVSTERPHSAHAKMNRGELIKPEWVGDPAVTGGFLYETTIHMFDMLRFLFGEVRELIALGSKHEYPERDDFSVLLKFESGFHATLASSADASWLFPFERVEVFCHHATIATREMETLVFGRGDHEHSTYSASQLSKEEKWGYVQEANAFIVSIIEGREPLVSALDGYKSVELVDGCYRAVESGQRVVF